jgi:transposase-like protein
MPRKSPFKHHRFPREIILCAIRWYLRYPLSYQDVVELLEERGVIVDRSTVYRWVQKFGPELTKRTEKHLRRTSVDWHVDETYIRVGGKWRYLWRAWRNNLIESDHAAMKWILGYRQGFRSLRSAKATLSGLETIRTIKRGHIHHRQPEVTGEIAFIDGLFASNAT